MSDSSNRSNHNGNNKAQQVANAAALVVRPETDAPTRQAASAFLESWTQSAEAWELYGPWLASFVGATHHDNNNHHADTMSQQSGVELLCLQLLQSKIRRELPRGGSATIAVTGANSVSLEAIRQALTQLILHSQSQQKNSQSVALLQSACICLTSLQVRLGSLTNFLQSILSSCHSSHASTNMGEAYASSLSPWTALRLLAEIPTELETCTELNTPAITAELMPHWPNVQQVLANHLTHQTNTDTYFLAAQALRHWVGSCHVTLSQLNEAVNTHGQPSILHNLVRLLAQTGYTDNQEGLLTAVSQCLTTVLRQPADSCTDTRRAATIALVNATHVDGFIGGPLQRAAASEWDDASHALVTLLTTLITEDIDEIIQLPADGLLTLLLEIQRTHPQVKIRSLVLEAWLTVQDVPTAERHEHWRAPLIVRISETLLEALAFPAEFSSWEDEFNVDQSEFEEYRQLAPDVLVSCYNLLRVDFLQRLTRPFVVSSASPPSWTQQEASLYGLTATAREVCGRLKTTVGGTQIIQDKQATATLLQQVATTLCRAAPPPPTVATDSLCQFWGAYAAAWARIGSSELVLQILEQLRVVLEQHQNVVLQISAAKAMKSVLSISATCLAEDAVATGTLLGLTHRLFSVAVASNEEDVMMAVAEGCVRLVVQIKDSAARDHAVVALAQTLTQHAQKAVSVVPMDGSVLSEHGAAAATAVVKYLQVLRVIIKFAQTDDDKNGPHILENTLNLYAWPFLEAVSQRMHHHVTMLDGVLSVQQQLLRSAPELLASQFSTAIQNCVAVFERTKNPSTLSFFSSAVEAYGSRESNAFENLLSHVSRIVFGYISSEKPVHECTDLVEAYFEMCQRYLLFCPAAVVRCEALSSIGSCAMECLTACKGERNSTRATLNFLERIIGWRRLPIHAEARQTLEIGSQRLDEITAAHGGRLIQVCIDMLVGGVRSLWPPAGDVVFAVILASVDWPVPEAAESSVARQWLEGVSLAAVSANVNHPAQIYRQVVGQLLTMAQKGPTMKAKAKLLLSDLALAINGQKTPDTIIA
eukprot:scaffold132_cov170-Amphora_coffeaeformis.AAC.23